MLSPYWQYNITFHNYFLFILLDKNECEEKGMCRNGICVNGDGSFKCICNPGYKLSPDGHFCIGMFIYLLDLNNYFFFIVVIIHYTFQQ